MVNTAAEQESMTLPQAFSELRTLPERIGEIYEDAAAEHAELTRAWIYSAIGAINYQRYSAYLGNAILGIEPAKNRGFCVQAIGMMLSASSEEAARYTARFDALRGLERCLYILSAFRRLGSMGAERPDYLEPVIRRPFETTVYPELAEKGYRHWETAKPMTQPEALLRNFTKAPALRDVNAVEPFYMAMRAFLLELRRIETFELPILGGHKAAAQFNSSQTNRSNERDLFGWTSICIDRTRQAVTELRNFYLLTAESRLSEFAMKSAYVSGHLSNAEVFEDLFRLGEDLAINLCEGMDLSKIEGCKERWVPKIQSDLVGIAAKTAPMKVPVAFELSLGRDSLAISAPS